MAKLTENQKQAINHAAEVIELYGPDTFWRWVASNKAKHEAKLAKKIVKKIYEK